MNSISTIKFGNREVGPGQPCYIIAEAGSNHNGELEKAFGLVDIAAKAGADCVKFQSVTFDSLTSNSNDKELQSAVEQITLDYEWYVRLKEYCGQAGVDFMSTPIYEAAVDELDSLDVVAFKLASMDLTNWPFIRYVAKKGRPLILSRGMSSLAEVGMALEEVAKIGNKQVALLHCISNYPTLPEQVNLKQIPTMENGFGVVTGFSDHTESEVIAGAAVALGSCIVEKHFTYDRSVKGFDHFYAMDPDMLKRMITGIREVEQALGETYIRMHETELNTKREAQRSIIVSRAINSGEILDQDNLTTKRPGSGISPIYWDFVVGRKATRDLEANHILEPGDFS